MKSHIPPPPTYTQSFPCCSHYTSVWCFSYNWLKKQCRYIVVQSPSHVQLSATPWTVICLAPLTISQSLPKFMSIELVMPPNHLILCCPLLFLPSIFPASESFPLSQLFASGGQSIGVSASAPVLPKSIQGWFPLRLTALTSFLSKGLSRVFSNPTVQKHWLFRALPSLLSSSHIHIWLPKRPYPWLFGPLLAK